VVPAIVLVLVIVVSVGFQSPELTVVVSGLGYLGLFAFILWNSCYRQGTTGQSIGRQVAKTKLVKIETGQPVGFGTALLRWICHNVEFVIGYLFPLWDEKRQTFADKIVGTVVVRVDG
jgi:uncharacterized RDD family membrane protein YckC